MNISTFNVIYKLVTKIPPGKVSTYGRIAEILSISPRLVGFALHANKNPQIIPCHRVVNKQGRIAKGYAFGGEKEQKKKLEEEGVRFKDKLHVDLEKHLFKCLIKM